MAVVGTGYLGMFSGACFPETGINVTCADTDENKINRLNQSQVPIYEPTELEEWAWTYYGITRLPVNA